MGQLLDKPTIDLVRLQNAIVKLHANELFGLKHSDQKWLAALEEAGRTVKKLGRIK